MSTIFKLNKDSVFTIGSNTIDCVTQVEINEDVSFYVSECEDANGFYVQIPSGITVTGTLTYEIKNDDITKLGYLAPLTTGTLTFKANGTTAGDISVTSTKITLGARGSSFSRGAHTTGTVAFACNDIAFAAIGA